MTHSDAHHGERRPLNVGDRIISRPCVVTIKSVIEDSTADGWCETCDCEHLIDRTLYEAGRGPWRMEGSDG